MRYNNQLTVKNPVDENSSKPKDCDNSSEISDSMESVVETNNNSTMNDGHFSWNINKKSQIDLAPIPKSFQVLCNPESENFETRDYKQAPTSR